MALSCSILFIITTLSTHLSYNLLFSLFLNFCNKFKQTEKSTELTSIANVKKHDYVVCKLTSVPPFKL